MKRRRKNTFLQALVRIALACALACGTAPFALFSLPAWAAAHDVSGAVGVSDASGQDGLTVQAKGDKDKGKEQGDEDDADVQAADAVVELIDALPSPANVKVSDREAIEEAVEAYDDLTKAQKALIDDEVVDYLDEVVAALDKELEDDMAASEVIALIEALPDPWAAQASDRMAAEEAQAALDALTADQQAHVSEALKAKVEGVLAAAIAAEEAERAGQDEGQEQQGGSSSSSSQSGGEKGSSSSSSASEGKDYVDILLLKWDEPDESGARHFVGEGPLTEEAYREISIGDYGKTVQLTGWYASTDGTGVIYQTADSSTSIGSFNLTWKSSDEGIASVTPAGLVKPCGKNGTVTITATVADKNVYKGKAPEAKVAITFSGQEGKYVEQVEILNEEGDAIGEGWGGVTVYNEANTFHQLQARVTWYDVATGQRSVEVTGSGDAYSARNVNTTITWNMSASNAFTINEDTGRLKTGAYSGNAYVTCTAVGGKDGDVTDTANVQLDTGVYEYNPAESLTLRAVWETEPDRVVKEATYSFDELLSMLPSREVNATVVNDSRFGVIMAKGFLFKDVVELVSVDDADVMQYRFGTADGYDNPVSYSYLFESGSRYYFPNYDLGGSKAEGEIVPPVLAYESVLEWNRSQANPNANRDSGNRFRLVFGCLNDSDSNTSFQIYYINSITVVLKGAPSAGDGDDDNGNGDGGEGGGNGNGDNGGEGGNNGGGNNSDDNGGKKSRTDNPSANPGTKPAVGNSQGPNNTAQSQQQAAGDQVASEPSQTQGQGGASGPTEATADTSKRWRVYQMMNKTNSDVPDWNDENPMAPFAVPLALGTFAVGAGATGIGFRRRLK